jgi:hypothetical protein
VHGSGSSISSESGYGSGSGSRYRSRVLMTKNKTKIQQKNFYHDFFIKNCDYISLGFHKGLPTLKKNLQPSKENIQHFKR